MASPNDRSDRTPPLWGDDFKPSPHDIRDHLPQFLRQHCPSQEQCRIWSAMSRDFTKRVVSILYGDAAVVAKTLNRRWRTLDWKWRIWSVCALLAAMLLPLLFIFGGRGPGPIANSSSVAANDKASPVKAESDVAPPKPDHADAPKQFHYPTPPPTPYLPDSDLLVADAYRTQRRFVTEYVYRSLYIGQPNVNAWDMAGFPKDDKWIFSPVTETKLVRNGNKFRVRGWVVFTKQGDRKYSYDTHSWITEEARRYKCDYLLEMRYDDDLEVWHLIGRVEQIN